MQIVDLHAVGPSGILCAGEKEARSWTSKEAKELCGGREEAATAAQCLLRLRQLRADIASRQNQLRSALNGKLSASQVVTRPSMC